MFLIVPKKVLVDADSLLYSVGFSFEDKSLSEAITKLEYVLDSIQSEVKSDDREIFIKGETNFRDEVCPNYKAHRVSRKPVHYAGLYEYIKGKEETVVADNCEADDEVSIRLYADYISGEENLIAASIDKDLNNTPGWHYNWNKKDLYRLSDVQATRHFCYQMLMGDKTDNISGCPPLPLSFLAEHGCKKTKGIGPVTAKKILKTTTGIDEAMYKVYEAYKEGCDGGGFPTTYLEIDTQGKLLWMARERNEDGTVKQFHTDKELLERVFMDNGFEEWVEE
jgi:5'-3' exonuclease